MKVIFQTFILFSHYLFRCLCYVNFFCSALFQWGNSILNIIYYNARGFECWKSMDQLIGQLQQVSGYRRPESSQCYTLLKPPLWDCVISRSCRFIWFVLLIFGFQCIENLAVMAEDDNISVASRQSLCSVRSVAADHGLSWSNFNGSTSKSRGSHWTSLF